MVKIKRNPERILIGVGENIKALPKGTVQGPKDRGLSPCSPSECKDPPKRNDGSETGG